MSKALLILERPICCELCYLNREREKGRYCVITNTYDKKYGSVKEDCPLKPLPPRRIDVLDSHTWQAGWNECLDAILGEEE